MKSLILAMLLIIAITGCASTATGGNDISYPNDSYPSDDSNSNSNPGGPFIVDVGQITPSENTGGENIVIPPPAARQSKAKMIHEISQDLSKRFGVDISEVVLIEAEEVTWADESLGCPMPDVNYEKNPINGLRIVVKLRDKEYFYHTRGLESFIWCDNGTPNAPVN